jgi:hypothetical protein
MESKLHASSTPPHVLFSAGMEAECAGRWLAKESVADWSFVSRRQTNQLAFLPE